MGHKDDHKGRGGRGRSARFNPDKGICPTWKGRYLLLEDGGEAWRVRSRLRMVERVLF